MTPQQLKDWMQATALPFWATQGWDEDRSLFFERMSWDGTPDRDAILRLRVQCRQIYSYAHAYHLGWYKDGAKLALRGFSGLQRHFHAPDGKAGYVHLLNPDLTINNPLRDSYDHAFVVLALGWLHRVTNDPSVRQALEDTLAFVDSALADPAGGLFEGLPASLPRRQNPQMHWFEAMLSLVDHGYPGAEQRLQAAYDHFQRMIAPNNGIIAEFFDDNWQAASGIAGEIIEPGHLAEWVWLLRQHERLTGVSARSQASLLLENAARFETGGRLVDEARLDGTVLRASSRSWLSTEWAKAWIAQAEMGIADADAKAHDALSAMARLHFGRPFAAGWVDQLDAQGNDVEGPVPASILYHVFVAVAEADRILLKSPQKI